jgi:L-lactate utilization protein LutC
MTWLSSYEKLSFREVQMSENRNMFETQPVARCTRDQEDELTERSAELLEEVALQRVVLGTALRCR